MNRKEILPTHQIKHMHQAPEPNPEIFHRIDEAVKKMKEKNKLGRPKGSKNKYSFSKFKKLDYELLINYLYKKGEYMEYQGITYSKKLFSSLYQDDVSFYLCDQLAGAECDDYEEAKKQTLEWLCPMIREYVKLRH